MVVALPIGRRGRLLAVGLAVLLITVLWAGIMAPLLAFYEDRSERLREREAVAEHMESLAKMLPALRESAQSAAKQGPSPLFTLEGGSDAVAAADLQNMVQDMALSAGATLASVEIVPADTVGQYRRIGLKLSFSAPWPVLLALLQSVDRASLPILVDDLSIHAQPAVPGSGQQILDAGFTIYAFRSGTPPKGPS